jgi:hypothetical protein
MPRSAWYCIATRGVLCGYIRIQSRVVGFDVGRFNHTHRYTHGNRAKARISQSPAELAGHPQSGQRGLTTIIGATR